MVRKESGEITAVAGGLQLHERTFNIKQIRAIVPRLNLIDFDRFSID